MLPPQVVVQTITPVKVVCNAHRVRGTLKSQTHLVPIKLDTSTTTVVNGDPENSSSSSLSQTTECENPSITWCAFLYLRDDFYIKMQKGHNFVMDSWLSTQSSQKGALMISCVYVNRPTRESIRFSQDAQKILGTPNAGGASEWSEALSFEILKCVSNATLEKTEMEIEYFPSGGAITDYQIKIRGESYGVSVTRAFKFKGPFRSQDGIVLLNKKLRGVKESSRLVMRPWKKQILHVLVEEDDIPEVLTQVYQNALSEEIKSDTMVFITLVKNAHWVMKQ